MNSLNDIMINLRTEVDDWFVNQCHNPYEHYYLYYLPSTIDPNSGLSIAIDRPTDDWQIASERISIAWTRDQAHARLLIIARTLPILDPRE